MYCARTRRVFIYYFLSFNLFSLLYFFLANRRRLATTPCVKSWPPPFSDACASGREYYDEPQRSWFPARSTVSSLATATSSSLHRHWKHPAVPCGRLICYRRGTLLYTHTETEESKQQKNRGKTNVLLVLRLSRHFLKRII